MEENILSIWSPVGVLPKSLEIDSMCDDVEGFRILLSSGDLESPVLRLHFQPVWSYRVIDEGYLLKTYEWPTGDNSQSCLYVVNESAYKKWFLSATNCDSKRSEIHHFLVVTSNDVVDVLAPNPPIVGWLSSQTMW